jgi:hypothetical protein
MKSKARVKYNQCSATHPSFFVKECLSSKDCSECALPELSVDDDPLARNLPLVQGEEGRGGEQAERAHPVFRLTHLALVSEKHRPKELFTCYDIQYYFTI